jgi:hypothetical protein
MLLAGLAGGAGAAWLATGQVDDSAGRGPFPWKAMAGNGSAAATPLQRATVARIGIWALPQTEVVYFNTEKDDAGRPLDVNCAYRLAGRGDPAARWWSIGAYRDYQWIDNPLNRYSISSTSIAREGDGGYVVVAGGPARAGNWLPLGDRPGRITLLFRLYVPDPAVMAAPERVPLPSVTRLGCRA